MKKSILFIGLCTLCVVIYGSLFAQNTELPRLAVAAFDVNDNSEKLKKDAITVREIVESKMVGTGKYRIIPRGDIDKLLANQKIQVSSISGAANIKKLKLQNISYIVTGSVNAIGDDYAVTVKMIDVSTGQFRHSADELVGSGSKDLYAGITVLMNKFTAGMSTTRERVSSRVYKVGDFGPAGGIVFYDKGNFSGGWRYLEAAPAETEFTGVQWGTYQKNIGNTSTGVGFGKRNTQLILEVLNRFGETERAAQLCASLSFGGYTDWFLPSKDELNLMYVNLKTKGLGGFGDYYWSSSEYSINYAWSQNVSHGYQYTKYKNELNRVRAVRAF